MNLRKVLFLGGYGQMLPSVQIRCIDIARRLGCDYRTGVRTVEDLPRRYGVFVCVKPHFGEPQLERLSKRGAIIWDVLDYAPPRKGITVYLASTKFAQNLLAPCGSVVAIPHHHCNFSGQPNPPNGRRPAWLGHPMWRPPLRGFAHDIYSTPFMRQAAAIEAYRHTGIGLNFRVRRGAYRQHIALNSGIKLINCLGFGIPSISGDEPAYHETGASCTIFSTLANCATWVRELQRDDALYARLRRNCLRQAKKFHIDSIATRYRELLAKI